jgi:type I restriction-modification system DNA methylase subunit
LRLLNRLIFIRTAEDREVEDNHLRSLVRVLKDKKQINHLDRELTEVFRRFDGTYNSELFARHFSEELQIPPSDLEQVIEGLYEKNYVRYNFNALDADVLGTAYEQYLGHVVAEGATETHVEEKRAKRKSQGIYYTPTFVTKYIVQQTVGRYLDEHAYNPSRPPRILDMACGSGSFLIEAFDVIDDFVAKLRGHAQKGEVDFYDRLRQLEVLQNCIFGVDKDKQAVEVARLNLLLRGLHSREKLPMLENIAHGDSLHPETFEMNFSQIMKEGGFDVIVGNPPYVRIQTLDKSEVEFFNQQFESATGNYDIYVLFVEKALQLLKPGGVLGFILPNKFMQTSYGEGLRKLLSEQMSLLKLVSFGDAQVFQNATTYTCMLFLKKEQNETFEYGLAERWLKEQITPLQLRDQDLSFIEIAYRQIGNEPWTLTNQSTTGLIGKLVSTSEQFGVIASRMFQGIRTSANEVYVLDVIKDEDDLPLLFSKALGKSVKIERDVLKPFLRGEDIKAYSIAKPTQYVIVPYHVIEGHATLIDAKALKKDSPLCWEYLLKNREALENREKGKMKHDRWYAYVYPKNLNQFGQPKIITPDIAPRSSFALDEKGEFSFVSGYGLILNENVLYDLKFILGLINSKVLDFYFKQISSRLQQGFYRYFSQYISQLPIRRIGFENLTEKLAHDEIVRLVERMLALQKERQSVRREDDLDRVRNLERQIAQVDAEIDQRVYALYGLTQDEIKIVEGG